MKRKNVLHRKAQYKVIEYSCLTQKQSPQSNIINFKNKKNKLLKNKGF